MVEQSAISSKNKVWGIEFWGSSEQEREKNR